MVMISSYGIYCIADDKFMEYVRKDITPHQLLIGKKESINSSFQLKIGKRGLSKTPIIIDMLTTPHILICGLSGSGKTKLIEYAIKGKSVVLLNAFQDDLLTIRGKRINGNDNILEYLTKLLKSPYKREKPLYIVMDELLILCMDNKIEKAIMNLLAVGRHYNIFLIGICQLGTKEIIKFKDLFNTRICFRQVEESSYRAVLGYSPEDKQLQKREFYYYSDEVGKGYTYDV